MSDQSRTRHDDGDWTPRPDPTFLTTAALEREVAALRSLINERLTGSSALVDEQFASIKKQFELIERQRVEQKVDGERAIAAALQAAKEAVQEQTAASEKSIAKSETATDKRIDQLGEKFDTAFDGQRRDIDDLSRRITIIESIKLGGQERVGSQAQSVGFVVAGFGLLLTMISIVLIVGDVLTP